MCGIAVGTTGATCAVSDAQNPELFVKVLIVEVSLGLMSEEHELASASTGLNLVLASLAGRLRSLGRFWVCSV